MIFRTALAICAWVVLAASPSLAASPEASGRTQSIVIRAGKADSPNHALARQFAEAVAVALNGAYTLDVQESQGSVENVMHAATASGNYVFTAGPDVIATARHGAKPFSPDRRYGQIRALFPMPAQTVEWVVRQDSGMKTLQDLAGGSFIVGAKGSVAEQATSTALQALDLDHRVQIMGIDTAAAPTALAAKQVNGFAIAGAYPLPQLLTFAKTTPIRLLSLSGRDLAKVLAADDSLVAEHIPKGTYPGLDEEITTLALPAGVYATTRMRDAMAYAITKAFWSQRAALATRNPPWQAVDATSLGMLGVKLHRGALRYYREAGITVPKALR